MTLTRRPAENVLTLTNTRVYTYKYIYIYTHIRAVKSKSFLLCSKRGNFHRVYSSSTVLVIFFPHLCSTKKLSGEQKIRLFGSPTTKERPTPTYFSRAAQNCYYFSRGQISKKLGGREDLAVVECFVEDCMELTVVRIGTIPNCPFLFDFENFSKMQQTSNRNAYIIIRER